MGKRRSFEVQLKIDVERMVRCAHDAGHNVTEKDLVNAWTDYSDSLCATWMALPEENGTLLSILLKHIESNRISRENSFEFTTTIVDAGDGTGDGFIEIPNDLLDTLGWREGDVLSVEVRDPFALVVQQLKAKKGSQEK